MRSAPGVACGLGVLCPATLSAVCLAALGVSRGPTAHRAGVVSHRLLRFDEYLDWSLFRLSWASSAMVSGWQLPT